MILTPKARRDLTLEGRRLKERIEALGYPRMWGKIPVDILQDVRTWQERCGKAGLSAASVYERLGGDPEKVSGTEALFLVDETLLQLDPPRMVGG